MSFDKKEWKQREGTGLSKYRVGDLGVQEITPAPDSITQAGDVLNAANFNDLEDRINDALTGALTCKGTWSTASSTPSNPQNGWAYRYTNSNPMTVAPYCAYYDLLYYQDGWKRLAGDYATNYRGTHSQTDSVPTGTILRGYWYRYAGSSKMTVKPYCSLGDMLLFDGSNWHAIGAGLRLVNGSPVAWQNIYAPTTVKGSTITRGILVSGTTSSPEPVWKEYPGDGFATSPNYTQADPGTSTSGTFRNYYAKIPIIGDSKDVFLLLNWGMFAHSEDQVVSITFPASYNYKNYALFFQDARNADGGGFTNGYSVYTTSTTGCTVKCRNYVGRAFYVAVGVC